MSADKLYSIGEVATKLNVPVHTIRYWTQIFEHIEITTRKGRRYYDDIAVSELKKIKDLAYKKGIKIDGIKQMLRYHKIDMKKIENALANSQQLALEKNIDFIDKIIEKIKMI